jgi:hypothetical protein
MNSSQIPNPRKRQRDPDDSTWDKWGRPQRQVARENTLRSHSVVPAVTHPEGASPSAIMRTNINNSIRTTELPDSTNLANHNELDDSIEEIAINYAKSGELYNKKNADIDINFVSKITEAINEDPEPNSIVECRKRSNWVKWKETIETELHSLSKRQVFGPITRTPQSIPCRIQMGVCLK